MTLPPSGDSRGRLFDTTTSCSDAADRILTVHLHAYDKNDDETLLATLVVLGPRVAPFSLSGHAFTPHTQHWFVEEGAAADLAAAQALAFAGDRPKTADVFRAPFLTGGPDDPIVQRYNSLSTVVICDSTPQASAFAMALGHGIELRMQVAFRGSQISMLHWFCNAPAHPGSIIRYQCHGRLPNTRTSPPPTDSATNSATLMRRPKTVWQRPSRATQWYALQHHQNGA